MREILLCDVDGVVADLMGGFSEWMRSHGLPEFDVSLLTKFDIRKAAREPGLIDLDDQLRAGMWPDDGGDGGLNGAFMTFMSGPAYEWVLPIDGAVEGVGRLREKYDVRFLTALMEAAPDHVPSKMRWMKRFFPDVKYFTSPSLLKQDVKGDIGIDDRYDTCMRWEGVGMRSFLFHQPWNEAPVEHMRYDWSTLLEAIDG